MQGRQCVRRTARDSDDAELSEPECFGHVLHVRDSLGRAPPRRELRPAHARAVRGNDPQPELTRRLVDIRCLVVRADQAVKKNAGSPARSPYCQTSRILPDRMTKVLIVLGLGDEIIGQAGLSEGHTHSARARPASLLACRRRSQEAHRTGWAKETQPGNRRKLELSKTNLGRQEKSGKVEHRGARLAERKNP